MGIKRNYFKVLAWAIGALLLGIAFFACSPTPPDIGDRPTPAVSLPPLEPLAAVAPRRNPDLPDWIERISPTGRVEPLAQVRVRFENPLIPLERLDSPGQQEISDRHN